MRLKSIPLFISFNWHFLIDYFELKILLNILYLEVFYIWRCFYCCYTNTR